MKSSVWRVAALLFGSGCCALVYQIGWLREFRLIFGASTAASAAVLAIFIGGLGLGGLLLGPRADRHPRPILFYAQLETIVGAIRPDVDTHPASRAPPGRSDDGPYMAAGRWRRTGS